MCNIRVAACRHCSVVRQRDSCALYREEVGETTKKTHCVLCVFGMLSTATTRHPSFAAAGGMYGTTTLRRRRRVRVGGVRRCRRRGERKKKGNGPVPTVRCLGRSVCVFLRGGGWDTRDSFFIFFFSSRLFSFYRHPLRHDDEHLLSLHSFLGCVCVCVRHTKGTHHSAPPPASYTGGEKISTI